MTSLQFWKTPYREVVDRDADGNYIDDNIGPDSELGKKLIFWDNLRPLIYIAPLDRDIVEFFKTPEAVIEALHRVMREEQAKESELLAEIKAQGERLDRIERQIDALLKPNRPDRGD